MTRRIAATMALFLCGCGTQASRFEPEGGGFVVEMPTPGTPSTADAVPGAAPATTWCNSAGRSLLQGLWRRALSLPFGYCVSYYDLPVTPGEVGPVLDQVRDLQVASLAPIPSSRPIAIERDEPILQGDIRGRSFQLRTASGHLLRGRAFIAGRRVYHLWVQGRAAQVESAHANTFLESFAVKR
jgi:hypothetical protein